MLDAKSFCFAAWRCDWLRRRFRSAFTAAVPHISALYKWLHDDMRDLARSIRRHTSIMTPRRRRIIGRQSNDRAGENGAPNNALPA